MTSTTQEMPLCPFCPEQRRERGEPDYMDLHWVYWPCCDARGPKATSEAESIRLASRAIRRTDLKPLTDELVARAEKAERERDELREQLRLLPECDHFPSSKLLVENSDLRAELERLREAPPDLDACPTCGGPADMGHDRCLPPSPYECSTCQGMPDTSTQSGPFGDQSNAGGETEPEK